MNGSINYNLSGTISNLNSVAPTNSEISILNDVLDELEIISGKHDNFLGNSLSSSGLTDMYSGANSSYTDFIGSLQEFSAMWSQTDQTSVGSGVGSSGVSSSGGKTSGGGSSKSAGKSSGSSSSSSLRATSRITTAAALSGGVTGAFKSAVPLTGIAAPLTGTVKEAISKISSNLGKVTTTTIEENKDTNNSSDDEKASESVVSGSVSQKVTALSSDKKAINKIGNVIKKATNISGLQKLSGEKVAGGLTSITSNTEAIKSLGETLIESGKNGLSQAGVLDFGTIKPGQAIATAKSASVLPAAMLALLSGGATAGGGYVLTKNKKDLDLSIDEYKA